MKFNKIGLYFGSFNPMHVGHVHVVKQALKIAIDKLCLVVSPQSPFKDLKTLAPYDDRIEMARLTLKDNKLDDRVEVVKWEKDKYPSFTIETLKEASKIYEGQELVMCMGLDNFLEIDKWKDPKDLLEKYSIYVIPRDTDDVSSVISKKVHELKKNITEDIKSVSYSNPFDTISVSATEIRKYIEKGKFFNGLLTPSVENYIKEKKLYGFKEDGKKVGV